MIAYILREEFLLLVVLVFGSGQGSAQPHPRTHRRALPVWEEDDRLVSIIQKVGDVLEKKFPPSLDLDSGFNGAKQVSIFIGFDLP